MFSISTDSVSVMVPVVTTLRVAVATKHIPACSAQGSYLTQLYHCLLLRHLLQAHQLVLSLKGLDTLVNLS